MIELADTTLMMATYNRLELTKRMIESLFKNDPGRDYNFVIVDNASADGTLEHLENLEFPDRLKKLILIKNKKNEGIAIARNQGLMEADSFGTTEWYCTLDNDVEMHAGWLQECVEILSANKGFGAIGVNMEDKPYKTIIRGEHAFQEKPQGNLGTACMVFPKKVHKMLGFFNTEYGPYGEEDADFGMRMRVVGFRLGYLEKMGVHFGVGAADEGEYREYKTACHKKNLAKFNQNVRLYYSRQKPIYIPFYIHSV